MSDSVRISCIHGNAPLIFDVFVITIAPKSSVQAHGMQGMVRLKLRLARLISVQKWPVSALVD
jgi:hypothetical protein